MLRKKFEYRISKYDIKFRKNGIYIKNEWTSVFDVGKAFDGIVFRMDEYERVENQYLSLIEKLCLNLGISEMRITNLEDNFNRCTYQDRTVLRGTGEIKNVARDCLREKYWCKLSARRLFIHFGYDYYIHVGCALDYNQISNLIYDTGLFVETMESPYK